MRFWVASVYIEDRTDTDMKLRLHESSISFWLTTNYQDLVRDYAAGIYNSSYSGSVYMDDSGSVCGYETFMRSESFTFHV